MSTDSIQSLAATAPAVTMPESKTVSPKLSNEPAAIKISSTESIQPLAQLNGTRRKRNSDSEAKIDNKKKRSLKEANGTTDHIEIPEPIRTSTRLQKKALKRYELQNENKEESSGELWAPTEKKKNSAPKRKKSKDKTEMDKSTQPVRKANGGLTNLGNTCFMNAVLQALFGMPVFISALKSFLSNIEAPPASLLNAVAILLEATETEDREKALNDLRNIIIEKHEIFDNYDMHDAHEFLQILLQNLAAECAMIISSFPNLKCPITETFQITSRLTRTCSNEKCKKETDGKEYGFNLSLNVPDNPSGVQSCISSFFNKSSMEKTCQLCKQNIEHIQMTRLEKIPRVLIVHFQRLTPKWDEKNKQFQTDKKCSPIELSSSCSLKYVTEKSHSLEEEDVKLNVNEIKYGIESIEQMKQWENKKLSESTIVVEDNKKMLALGPRAIKQLTEEQQLKLALLKSMEEDDDEDDDIEISENDRLAAAETDYLSAMETNLLRDNSGLSIAQDPHISESYSLLASVNHHGTQADTGHYTADVLNPVSQKWTSFNDSRVRTILEKTVKGRKKVCYLLFYMRKEYGTQLISAYNQNSAKQQL